MGSAARVEAPPLTEPVPVEDTFVTGMDGVEVRGDFVRLNFFSERALIETRSASENAIVARIVTTPERLRRMIRQMQLAIERMGH